MAYDLEFEKPLAELEKKINGLQRKGDRLRSEEHIQLQEAERELRRRTEEIYKNLTSWQTVQVACHQKGRDTKAKQHHNFGMPHPEGYRKARRLMQQAEKFGFPIVCLIDTPGAFPALADEERGQAEAIASNLYLMSRLRVPIIAIVIGEGGSGGALAISVADRLLMMEYSIYTVAAPEAAASILWRDAGQAARAAEAMRISAHELKALDLVDELIPEPLGGAHHNHRLAADNLKKALLRNLAELQQLPVDELLEKRYQKFRAIGQFDRLSQLDGANILTS